MTTADPFLTSLMPESVSTETLGRRVSALSNYARSAGAPCGYAVWGIGEDASVRGTELSWQASTGRSSLCEALYRILSPSPALAFEELSAPRRIVVLRVPASGSIPVRCSGVAYTLVRGQVRAASQAAYRPLSELQAVTRPDSLAALQPLLATPLQPGTPLLVPSADGHAVTAALALLSARSLEDFPRLASKAVRLADFEGSRTLREGLRGAVAAVERQAAAAAQRWPLWSRMPQGVPGLLVRFAAATQDLAQPTGLKVLLEDDALTVSWPLRGGLALEDLVRPSALPNPVLAGGLGVGGSELRQISEALAQAHLAAPLAERSGEDTVLRISLARPLRSQNRCERIRTVALAALAARRAGQFLTNTAVRGRFGLENSDRALAGRFLREALEAGVIEEDNPQDRPRDRRYRPRPHPAAPA